jgi:hypothetical protein
MITKEQIGKYVNLSQNIDDLDVKSIIYDAITFDTVSVLPENLLTAIKNVGNVEQWNLRKAYVIGDIILYNEKYYTAIANNTGSKPPSSDWEDNELMNFYLEYLVPFIALSFNYRFLASHGAKITQSGITQHIGADFQPVSDKFRGEMLGDARNKTNIVTAKMSKKLEDVDYTFDGVAYPQACKKVKAKIKIWGV